jgi:hypothetical protein
MDGVSGTNKATIFPYEFTEEKRVNGTKNVPYSIAWPPILAIGSI